MYQFWNAKANTNLILAKQLARIALYYHDMRHVRLTFRLTLSITVLTLNLTLTLLALVTLTILHRERCMVRNLSSSEGNMTVSG